MKVLVMRTVGKSLKSYNGFTYPEKGLVKCPDWKPSQQCGNGLHGLLWGHGSSNIPTDNVLFQLIEVEDTPDNLIEFDGKCKFREGEVVFTGTQEDIIKAIKSHPNYPKDNILNFDIQITTDNNKIMQSGYKSTQKAGNWSTQKAGYKSTQKAGNWSTQTAGDESTQTAGDESTQTAGYESTQKAGNWSTQTAGVNSIQIGYWYDDSGDYQVVSRIVTKDMADKPYKFETGKWTLVK